MNSWSCANRAFYLSSTLDTRILADNGP